LSELARLLWQARRSGGVVDPDDCRQPRSIEEAYAIQHAIAALRGAPPCGFKVGSTSLEAQRTLGTDQPGSGVLLAPDVHETPAGLRVDPAHTPAVEGEFAFRLAHDLPPRAEAYGRADIVDAVAAVAGAIEVVGSRFSGGLAGKGRLLVTADGGANIALVLGPWTSAWKALELRNHSVVLTINGALRGEGRGERALGDPLNVLVWLANRQSAVGRGLKAGDIVSTGTCTGLAAVHPGDAAQADFGDLGRVEVSFA
jgi:2-keto-4-pentenoate hydratase